MSRITIDAARCTRCGTCAATCPEAIFAAGEADATPKIVHESVCTSCGHCVAICPHDAIHHSDFPEGSIRPVDHDRLPSHEQVLELLRARRSLRDFEDEPVERELLEKVLDAARFAPTAHNTQSTEYIVIQDKAALDQVSELTARYFAAIAKQIRNPLTRVFVRMMSGSTYESVLGLLPDLEMLVEAAHEGKDLILRGAPCLVVCHAEVSVHFPDQNATLALHNATLAAETLGLGSFHLGYIVGACKRDKRIARLLDIPKNHEVYGAMAFGHPKRRFTKWIERKPPRVRWV
jgi:nitroreductase/NAD-dependent dihydropyrimidine dehydrogenase PreA subunit